jgi:hypothetical protein
MSRRGLHSVLVSALLAGLLAALAGAARGQQEQAVLNGIQYLRGRAANQQVGETAMIALALIKADTPKTDPVLSSCIATILKRFTSSGYNPQRRGGHDVYEAAVVAMALANLDGADYGGPLGLVAAYLQGRQNANGSWDYTSRTHGDCSISQYAVLGLWECQNAGVDIPPSVWDRAAKWYLSVQSSQGSWNYHRDEGQYGETISMTAAGVGSLLICKRQLERFRQSRRGTSQLMTVLAPEHSEQNYEVTTTSAQINEAVKKGMAWIGANFTTTGAVVGQTVYYALYGIERIGALADRQTIGKVDWFERGRSFIRSTQQSDGAWRFALHGDEPNTVWAILFLTKSTAKSIQRVVDRRLGAGTLMGGRDLPKDLSSITVAGGKIMSRPMNGAVEGMLAVLEDPRAQNADTAVAGLIERAHREGPAVLRPFKDRFLRLLADRDPGLRQVAAWALSRMDELDVVPALIEALVDAEENVVTAAKLGLQLLSRKIDGLGPPSPSTPEQRQEAAKRWRAWYDSIRPLEAEGEGDQSPLPPGRSAAPRALGPAPAPIATPARPRSSSP